MNPRTVGPLRAAIAVAVATALFLPFRSLLGQQLWGLPYLLVVGFVAGNSGVGPALFAAVLAFLAWNFCFIPPYYTFHVAHVDDLTYLFTFLVVAAALGFQTGRLRNREEAALRGERKTAALHRLSDGLVAGRSLPVMARSVSREVIDLLGATGAAVWVRDSEGRSSPIRWPGDDLEPLTTLLPEDQFIPLETPEGSVGALQVRWPARGGPTAADTQEVLSACAHLAAAFLESRRLEEKAISAEAARETEGLRSALVSSVSHELRTPLASLTATVSDLLEEDVSWNPGAVRAKLDGVLQDIERLDGSIADMLDASRLETRTWQPVPEVLGVGEILGDVVSRLSAKSRKRITYSIPDSVPAVLVDGVQVSRALRNIVDNALRYSDSIVTVGAEAGPDCMRVWIEDCGPGIGDEDKPLVFDKFYRGESGRRSRSSTGLGLSIARDIVLANGGTIRIDDAAGGGTRVVLELPEYQDTVPNDGGVAAGQ